MSNAAIQTDFFQYFQPGKSGGFYDSRPYVAESYVAESNIRYGQGVVAGTNADRQVITPSATGQIFMGISIAIWQIEQQLTAYPTDSSGLYTIESLLPVLRRGAIWVRVNTDVEPNDPVYLVYANLDPTLIGNFRNDAGTLEADLVANALFRKSAKAGELSVVEINMP